MVSKIVAALKRQISLPDPVQGISKLSGQISASEENLCAMKVWNCIFCCFLSSLCFVSAWD
jgi:hypothetical protein